MNVKVYHVHPESARDLFTADGVQIAEAFTKGGTYYEAGTVQWVKGYGEITAILDHAWSQSQNECHPNHFIDGEMQPAVWNGEFAQRSSMMGDIFEVSGQFWSVSPVGYVRLSVTEVPELTDNFYLSV